MRRVLALVALVVTFTLSGAGLAIASIHIVEDAGGNLCNAYAINDGNNTIYVTKVTAC
ncbi:MAG TPA: hypothetical protein VM328_10410 [Fimbriimonadaceae bacterium]|nr:hypothetical protein [Fimbriimonadaceae bacterium]